MNTHTYTKHTHTHAHAHVGLRNVNAIYNTQSHISHISQSNASKIYIHGHRQCTRVHRTSKVYEKSVQKKKKRRWKKNKQKSKLCETEISEREKEDEAELRKGPSQERRLRRNRQKQKKIIMNAAAPSCRRLVKGTSQRYVSFHFYI